LVGLDDLRGDEDDGVAAEAVSRWAELWGRMRFHVEHRVLCTSDPRFFQRARSGFGGFNAARVIGRLGHPAFGAAHGSGGHGGG
jgi:hypothetical protein